MLALKSSHVSKGCHCNLTSRHVIKIAIVMLWLIMLLRSFIIVCLSACQPVCLLSVSVCLCLYIWLSYESSDMVPTCHIALNIKQWPKNGCHRARPGKYDIPSMWLTIVVNSSGRPSDDHRCGHPQRVVANQQEVMTRLLRAAICFEHKTLYLLIRARYTRIVVFWNVSIIPPMISQSQISCYTPTFCIAAIFVKYCYTTGSWLL